VIRSSAAVDRLSGEVSVHRTACLEFSPGAGMWAVVAFDGQEDTGIETRLQAFVHQAKEYAKAKGYDNPRVWKA